ncbi:hypothetical protein DY000_02017029 [Brassica cretica]|uniref:Uncharacterized protein n=1 Tax=Brassica cretica TaxID=69181 RepID=A0ABQ7CT65_BRACR|nr:hypothetical protein DY000_02017029 [Brassica cretica]
MLAAAVCRRNRQRISQGPFAEESWSRPCVDEYHQGVLLVLIAGSKGREVMWKSWPRWKIDDRGLRLRPRGGCGRCPN